MANFFNDLTTMLKKIIIDSTRFHVPRLGKIVNINDSQKKGRVLVQIPSLGWDTNDKAAWCYPKDKKSFITPKVNDFVIIEFLDGNIDYPLYSGMANQMKDMIPKSYDGNPTTQIIHESTDGQSYIKSDELLKELTICFTQIILKTGDAAIWQPNILAIDPLTGVPHGGPNAGIVKLKGA